MGAALLGGGVSGCEGEGVWVLVFAEVVAVVFLLEVVLPVGVVVVVGVDGAVPQDGLGAGGGPAGSGDVHAVFDEVAAGAFDDAGGDEPAGGEGGGGTEVGLRGVEVGQGPGDVLRVLGALGRVLGGEAGDQAGDPGGAAVQDARGPGGGSVLDGGGAGPETRPAPPAERRGRRPGIRAAVQSSMTGSRAGKRAQPAFHTYSMTWIRSMRMVTVTPRRAASASIRAIWWLSPSTRAMQFLSCRGSRSSAWSKSQVTDSDRSAVMSAR